MNQVKLHIADANYLTRVGLESIFQSENGVVVVGVTEKSDDLKKNLLENVPEVLLINYQSDGFHSSDVYQT